MTNFLKDALLVNHDSHNRSHQEVADILNEEIEGVTISQEEPGFEMVTRVSTKRMEPLVSAQNRAISQCKFVCRPSCRIKNLCGAMSLSHRSSGHSTWIRMAEYNTSNT